MSRPEMAPILWTPSLERREASAMFRFVEFVRARTGRSLADYDALWTWSVTELDAFWAAVWDFVGIRSKVPYQAAFEAGGAFERAQWFRGASLNFAENLLVGADHRVAIAFMGEDGTTSTLTYAQLRAEVAAFARGLAGLGVGVGDRVVGFVPNLPEAVVSMLAAATLGATWSSCSPDFGPRGVIDRFGQIAPKVLVVADGYRYRGKEVSSLETVRRLREEVRPQHLVVIPYLQGDPDLSSLPGALRYADVGVAGSSDPAYAELPFDHPQYVMYSSGTTGLPKCMVQSAGGVLLMHRKEHVLHVDLRPEDVLFYFTTTGWMMWNWLVSGLASGCTIVLYEGSPFHPDPLALFKMAEKLGVTIFGTSAKYLAALEKASARPREQVDLTSLRTILSTGSPLAPESFRYVYRAIKEDVLLASISGGTDLNGCFALGNPLLPVREGELQCRALGMGVQAYDETGHRVVGQKGELVCETPFPSMPLRFWGDSDGRAYRAAYFSRFPAVWAHGDFIEVTREGGVIVYGRSDATLNPGGVRIGTAEIYRVVETLPEVVDSLVVGQDWEGDVRVVLFVKLAPDVELTSSLEAAIRAAIRAQTTPRHVPEKIVAVPDIPYTISGKKVELAVREVIHGRPATNREALANPEALDAFEGLAILSG